VSVNEIDVNAVNARAAAAYFGKQGGEKGGKSKSPAKMAAIMANLKKAQEARKLSTAKKLSEAKEV
jgi:hypothetical protein